MDDQHTVDERLRLMDAKLDKVVAVTDQLEKLFEAWMTGGRGRLLVALAKARGERS